MFVMLQNNSGNFSNFHMVIKQRLEDQYEQQWRDEINESSNVLCIVFLRRNLNSNNMSGFYHCLKEKHFVNLENVITSYLMKSDVIQTYQELIRYMQFL